MRKYFSYIGDKTTIFRYAPEDGNGSVLFPINSVIHQTSKFDEDIFVVVIIRSKTKAQTLIDFKEELSSIHNQDKVDLKILRVEEVFPKYLIPAIDYMIINDYISSGDLMYWDTTNVAVSHCIHNLYIYANKIYNNTIKGETILVIGDTIFNTTSNIDFENYIYCNDISKGSVHNKLLDMIK